MVSEKSRQDEINTWFYFAVNNLSANDVVHFSKLLAITNCNQPLLSLVPALFALCLAF